MKSKMLILLGVCSFSLALLQSCDFFMNMFGVKSTDATLASISIPGASFNKQFNSTTFDYSAIVSSTTTQLNVTAKASNEKAIIQWSPNPSSVTLSQSEPVDFLITVTAEDGKTKNTYHLTVYRANTTLEVLDSVNGSRVPTSGIIEVFQNNALVYSVPLDSNPDEIWLQPGHYSTIKVTPTGRAQSSLEAVKGAEGKSLIAISQHLDQSTFPAKSPVIEKIEYTTSYYLTSSNMNSAQWAELQDGDAVNFATVGYIKITGYGFSEVEPTSWGGFGINIGLDEMPTYFSGYYPREDLSTFTYDASTNKFTGYAVFDLRYGTFTSGEHKLYIVIYDRTNNRTERVLTVTNSQTAITQYSDISSCTFYDLWADFRIYGASREYFKGNPLLNSFNKKNQLHNPPPKFALKNLNLPKTNSALVQPNGLISLPTGPISYRVSLSFRFIDNSNNDEPILGFKVLRSEDGSQWKHISTVNYAILYDGDSEGYHYFYDTDSSLTTNKSYYYKIIAFTDDIHKKESNVIGPAKFLPPFTLSLTSPVDHAIVDPSNLPDFIFTISDPSLLDGNTSTYMYFSPVIRNASGDYAYVGYFAYDLEYNSLYYWNYTENNYVSLSNPDPYISINKMNGTITLHPSIFTGLASNYATEAPLMLNSGAAYFWDMFGFYDYGSNDWPVYFEAGDSTEHWVSRSLADGFSTGAQSTNGWFSFSVK